MKKYDVVSIGELNPDFIMMGFKSMPVLGREIQCGSYSLVLGSSTAICACGMARLGLRSGFISKTGDDDFGRFCVSELERYGIDASMVTADRSVVTGVTIAITFPHDRALVTCPGAIAEFDAVDVPDSLMEQTRHIHVGSFFLQPRLRSGLPALFEKARAAGVTVSLDAGWDDTECWDYGILDILKNVDVFFPNEGEAMAIAKTKNAADAAAFLSRYCGIVAVKRGKDGAYIMNGGGVVEKPAYIVRTPVDTTGAGDSFNAGFIYAWLNGMCISDCADYGNAAAAICVTRVGGTSDCARLDEVRRVITAKSCDVLSI